MATSGTFVAAGLMVPSLAAIADAKKSREPMQPVELDLNADAYRALGTIGGAVKIPDPTDRKRPIIVIRSAEDTYAAFSSRCTHWGCEVELPAEGVLLCKCHHSKFDLNGRVTHGPAKKDLRQFATALEGSRLTITEIGG